MLPFNTLKSISHQYSKEVQILSRLSKMELGSLGGSTLFLTISSIDADVILEQTIRAKIIKIDLGYF